MWITAVEQAAGPSIAWMVGAWMAILGGLTALVIVCYYIIRAVRHRHQPQQRLASWPPPQR